MGWTVVEPLSPGLFQIDPAIYDAESQVFEVPLLGQTLKKIIKALQDKIAARAAAKVQAKVAQELGEEISEDAAQEAVEEVMEEAYVNTMKQSNPEYWAWKEGGEVGTRPALNLSGNALDNAVEKEAVELASKKLGAKEVAEETIEEVAPATSKALLKNQADDAAQKGTGLTQTQKDVLAQSRKFGVYGVGAFIVYDLFGAVGDSVGGAIGDWSDQYTGKACNDIDDQEERETCRNQANMRMVYTGIAGVGLLGLLGVVLITRLIPAKEPKEEEEEKTEE